MAVELGDIVRDPGLFLKFVGEFLAEGHREGGSDLSVIFPLVGRCLTGFGGKVVWLVEAAGSEHAHWY